MDDRSPLSDRLRRLATRYEADVSHGRAEQLAARAVARAHRAPSRRHQVAAVVVSSAFGFVALTGLGAAADTAVPGDFLYPVDRAIEAIGLDGDALEERLEEAIELADRGDRERVFLVANEALEEVNRSGVQVRRPALTTVPTEPLDDAPPVTVDAVAADATTTTVVDAPATTAAPVAAPTAEAGPVDDPVRIIRLEAENLLRTVREAREDPNAALALEEAAGSLANAVDAASTTTTTTTTTSTTTSSTSTTSTTSPSSTTTTTTDPTSSTTSTTVVGDGGDEDGSEPPDEEGSGTGNEQPPITLPQP